MFQTGRRLFQFRFERLFALQVAGSGLKGADDARQRVRQDGSQPTKPFRFGFTPKLRTAGMRLEDRLLYDVRGVQFPVESGLQMEPGEDAKVVAITFQRTLIGVGCAVHVFKSSTAEVAIGLRNQAMMALATFPLTSVSLISRPAYLKVNFSWSSPSKCKMVACQSEICILSWTAS